jgi:hypothetical protein
MAVNYGWLRSRSDGNHESAAGAESQRSGAGRDGRAQTPRGIVFTPLDAGSRSSARDQWGPDSISRGGSARVTPSHRAARGIVPPWTSTETATTTNTRP